MLGLVTSFSERQDTCPQSLWEERMTHRWDFPGCTQHLEKDGGPKAGPRARKTQWESRDKPGCRGSQTSCFLLYCGVGFPPDASLHSFSF